MTDPDLNPATASDALPRRRVLRAAAGLAAAGALAGCNDDTSGTSTDSPGSPAASPADSPTETATPVPTATPTAPPTDVPTATPSPTPTATAAPTATPAGRGTAREFVAHLRSGEFDAAHALFSDALASRVPRPTLERYWLGLTAQHGPVERAGSVTTETRDGSEVFVVPLECSEGSQRVQVGTDDEGLMTGLWFPGEYGAPEYVDESAFTERTLTLEPDGCSLPAALTVPEAGSGGTATDSATATDADGTATATAADSDELPGVVLVHGSGAHDRDETIGPNRPFRDLAHGLASRGVAVLRYEKRTAACEVPRSEWAIDDIIVDDAVHALGVLREQDEVAADRTAVAGHSVGATCVPRIAERDGAVAGGVLLAGNARPFTEVYLEQVEHIFSVQGGLSAQEEQQLAAFERLMNAVEDGSVADDRAIGPLPGIWWKTLHEYDQVATASRVDAPFFFAHGGRDFQIPIDPAMDGWREGLDDPDAHRFERYPELSHLFQPGEPPSLQTEYNFADNVAGALVTDLADWLTGL